MLTPKEMCVLNAATKNTMDIDTCSVDIVSHNESDKTRFLAISYTEKSYNTKYISVDTAYELLDFDNNYNLDFFRYLVRALYVASYKG